MIKYLVSARSAEYAKHIAESKGLGVNDWVHVPVDFENPKRRERALNGRRVPSKDYLLGLFSNEEVRYLVIPDEGKSIWVRIALTYNASVYPIDVVERALMKRGLRTKRVNGDLFAQLQISDEEFESVSKEKRQTMSFDKRV